MQIPNVDKSNSHPMKYTNSVENSKAPAANKVRHIRIYLLFSTFIIFPYINTL